MKHHFTLFEWDRIMALAVGAVLVLAPRAPPSPAPRCTRPVRARPTATAATARRRATTLRCPAPPATATAVTARARPAYRPRTPALAYRTGPAHDAAERRRIPTSADAVPPAGGPPHLAVGASWVPPTAQDRVASSRSRGSHRAAPARHGTPAARRGRKARGSRAPARSAQLPRPAPPRVPRGTGRRGHHIGPKDGASHARSHPQVGGGEGQRLHADRAPRRHDHHRHPRRDRHPRLPEPAEEGRRHRREVGRLHDRQGGRHLLRRQPEPPVGGDHGHDADGHGAGAGPVELQRDARRDRPAERRQRRRRVRDVRPELVRLGLQQVGRHHRSGCGQHRWCDGLEVHAGRARQGRLLVAAHDGRQAWQREGQQPLLLPLGVQRAQGRHLCGRSEGMDLSASRTSGRPGADRGFTLVELLVVMIVVGPPAAIAVPIAVSQRRKAYETSAKADVQALVRELGALQVDADGAYDITGSDGTWSITRLGTVVATGRRVPTTRCRRPAPSTRTGTSACR